jgi:hypothetical protein
MSFQYPKVKGLALLTSRILNGQPYRQNPPISARVSMATGLATSNLATFVKVPLYKLTPRCRKHREERQETQKGEKSHHIQSEEESCRHHHHHLFLHLIAIAIYL